MINTNPEVDYMRSIPIRRLRHPLDDSPMWGIIGSALASVVAVVLGLPVVIILFVVLPFVFAVKWFLLLFYWNRQRADFSEGGVESMTGNDSRWLGSAWKSSVLHAILVFDSHIEVSTLRNLVLTRVVPLYPRLTRQPFKLPLFAGSGHCWLPDTNFHIDNHVFHGPPLKDFEVDLQKYISRLLVEGLPMGKPPWELHLLQESGTKTESVAVLRIHNSVADGPALLKLLCSCLSDNRIITGSRNCSRKPASFYYNLLRGCLLGPMTFFLWLLLSPRDCNLLTHKSNWSGQMKISWSATITLSKVNRIKQVTRSTTNCVLLAALAGALRIILQKCGVRQPPDMRVVVPVNLRSRSSSRDETELGSKMSPVVVSLPVSIEGAVPRLWYMRKALSTLRCSSDGVIVYLATSALMTLLPSQSLLCP
uniref:diacylglycerol O-acyltransferase n=1 Tax=Clastoptera arizonana TaxID=38151 RepID=A0A1B6C173_9HEMI